MAIGLLLQSSVGGLASDGTNYATDELGNLTGISGGPNPNWSYSYDSWSQLKSATQGATTITYALDALGRLLTRTNGSASTSYLYRGVSEDITKATPSAGSATTYAYSAGGPLAQKTGTTSRLMLRDLHGDVVGLTTTTGTVQGSRTFDPYGKPRTTTGESSALGFQGAPTDTNTGLVDMVTRHYAPTLGRFITADQVFGTLMLPISLNRFSYAGANPVSFTDPDGMCANPEYCPAPTTSSTASANAWYETGATLNEPSYGESSGYRSYVNTLYMEHPEIRPPSFRPQFFNRLPRLVGMEKNYRPPEDEGGGFFGFLHTALDVVGFIPVVGEIADGANAALYAVEGDWGNAAIYAGAILIPTSGKVLRAGKELVEEGVEAALKSTVTANRAVGMAGESALRQLVGGEGKHFATEQGGRFVDAFADGIAHESKVGYTAMSPRIASQVSKDAEIVLSGQARGAMWHFFQSPTTGKIGPSSGLRAALDDARIPYQIHGSP